jgi:hypothetical protein
MPDIRCDNCPYDKKLAEYNEGKITFKLTSKISCRYNDRQLVLKCFSGKNNPRCQGCDREKRIYLDDLISATSEIKI